MSSPQTTNPSKEDVEYVDAIKEDIHLRAKIDLNSGNFNMRDPVIYRINHAHHHNTGDEWCIYTAILICSYINLH